MFFKNTNKKISLLETNLNDLVTKNISLEKKNTELENKIKALNITNNIEYINKLDSKLISMSKYNAEMYNKYTILLETCNFEIKKTNKNIENNTTKTIKSSEDIEQTLLKINELKETLSNNIVKLTIDFYKEVEKNKEENLQINKLINNLKNRDINLESQIETIENNLENTIEISDEKRGWRLFG